MYFWRYLPLSIKRFVIETIGYFFKRDIKFFGEFGTELIAVIPYAYWLFKRNKLNTTKSTMDTKCLYYFSKSHSELNINRSVKRVENFPVGNIHVSKLHTSQWFPPPYKKVYANNRFIWKKPTCIICNKYTDEWRKKPINFFSIEVLTKIFNLLKNKYQIVYNRPTSTDLPSSDHQKHHFLGDMNLIKNKYPEIITIQELADKNKNISFNQLQMEIYANCKNFISVQGGSSILTSYFGGKNIIFAKKGGEVRSKSYNWYYKFSGSQIFHIDNYNDLLNIIQKEFL
ncbi:MAG: hypothetical protein ACFE9M_01740 [Promethearchaeota archaeon]